VHLAVGDHLQPMLDRAEEAVCGGQFGGGAARDVSGPYQQPQRAQRGGRAQLGVSPAPDELQGLHQELDLADAALAELHVVAGYGRNLSRFAGEVEARERRG
jgi:hypothetical protein